jgi:hypothetical protein
MVASNKKLVLQSRQNTLFFEIKNEAAHIWRQFLDLKRLTEAMMYCDSLTEKA